MILVTWVRLEREKGEKASVTSPNRSARRGITSPSCMSERKRNRAGVNRGRREEKSTKLGKKVETSLKSKLRTTRC